MSAFLILASTVVPDSSTAREANESLSCCSEHPVSYVPDASSLVVLFFLALAALWMRRDGVSRLLMKLDRGCLSVLCPSFSKRERLVKWATTRLPPTWSSHLATLTGGISELWKDGSLLCTIINSAIPGACPNPHRHWRKPPSHAQEVAFKYLGVHPIFSSEEFDQKTLKLSLEEKFLQYLLSLQHAITKYSAKTSCSSDRICTDYLVRGMGLFVGEQNRKTTFYIYSNSKSPSTKGVLINIRGPYSSCAKTNVLPFHTPSKWNSAKQLQPQNIRRRSIFATLTRDIAHFIQSGNNPNAIPLKVEMEVDRAKVVFIPKHTGVYQIDLSCGGDPLSSSPFMTRIYENDSGIQDAFETIEKKSLKRSGFHRKRIIAKVIDFVDEKLTLKNFCSNPSIKLTPPECDKTSNKKEGFCEQTQNVDNEKTASPVCVQHTEQEAPKAKFQTCDSIQQLSPASYSNGNGADATKGLTKSHNNDLKSLFIQRKEYWRKLTSAVKRGEFKSVPNNLNSLHKADAVKRLGKTDKDICRSMDLSLPNKINSNIPNGLKRSFSNDLHHERKLDFAYSSEKISEESNNFLSVRDRKEILLEQLTDEQKLLLEKKLRQQCSNNQKSHKQKKKLCRQNSINDTAQLFEKSDTSRDFSDYSFHESYESKVHDEIQDAIEIMDFKSVFLSAKNYFERLADGQGNYTQSLDRTYAKHKKFKFPTESLYFKENDYVGKGCERIGVLKYKLNCKSREELYNSL